MKLHEMINIDDISSPCTMCYIKGHEFSIHDEHCKRCEYNIAIQMLKRILKDSSPCDYCLHSDSHANECELQSLDDFTCKFERDFVIDWKSLLEKYTD